MDTLIHHKSQNYRRGIFRLLSAIGCPIMFFLHAGPITRGFTSSLAEIGMLACFLLWIASQYNVWGKVYIVYEGSTKCSINFPISAYITSQYKQIKTPEDSSNISKITSDCYGTFRELSTEDISIFEDECELLQTYET